MANTPRPLADIAIDVVAALPRRDFLAGLAALPAATGGAFLNSRPAGAAAPAIATPIDDPDAPATTPFGLLAKLGVGADGFGVDDIAEYLARERSPDGASAGAVLVSAMRDWRALFPAAALA